MDLRGGSFIAVAVDKEYSALFTHWSMSYSVQQHGHAISMKINTTEERPAGKAMATSIVDVNSPLGNVPTHF
jgi:hypothetical protein